MTSTEIKPIEVTRSESLQALGFKSNKSRLKTQIIQNINDFKSLEPEWNSFLKQCQIENICLQYEWIETFLKHYPQERLAIVLVRDEQKHIVGLAPLTINHGNIRLFQRALNFLRFIGSKEYIYDWMAFPIHQDADSELVLQTIVDALFSIRHQWDVLDLQACLEHNQLQALSSLLKSKGGSSELEEGEGMPQLKLPASIEDYNADKRKKRVHRDTRRFHKKWEDAFNTPIEIEHLYPSALTEQEMDIFFEQHANYWVEKFGKSNFRIYPQLSQFYKDIFNLPRKDLLAPCLAFSRLVSGNKVLSYQFGIWYQWGYMNYINSYHPDYKEYRTGILHSDVLIRQCVEWEHKIFSFGQGEESYKSLWSEKIIPLYYFRYFRTPLAKSLYQADLSLKQFLLKIKKKPEITSAEVKTEALSDEQ